MTETTTSTGPWKAAVGVLAIAAAGAGAYGFQTARQASELDAALKAARAEAAQLRAQVSTLEARAKDTEARLAESSAAAQAQLADANATIEAAKSRLADESRPDLPVAVTFRKALLGSGLVATFRNTSQRVVEVRASFESPSTGASKSAAFAIDPGIGVQVGYAQGWTFAPGQKVELSNPAFRPVVLTVPEQS